MIKTIWTTIIHNQVLVVSVVICVILVVWSYGCQVTTRNPFAPTTKVTRPELEAEVENYATRISLAYADLQKQEEIRSTILNVGLAYAEGGTVNIVGLISTLSGIAGIGAVIDNRRKDAVIKSKTNALNSITNNNRSNT